MQPVEKLPKTYFPFPVNMEAYDEQILFLYFNRENPRSIL